MGVVRSFCLASSSRQSGTLCLRWLLHLVVWGVLFAARMLAGFGNANIGTAQAIIADVTTAENRSTGMALIGVAFGLGFLFGPAVGGYLGGISPSMPFWVAGGLSVVNWFFALFFLKETKTAESTHKARPIFDLELFKRSKQYQNVSSVLWITLIYTTAFALMEQAIALYIEHVWITDTTLSMEERIEAAGWKTANYLVIVGVTAIIVQGGLVRPMTKRFGEVWMTRVGIGFVVVAIAGIPLLGDTANFTLFCATAVVMAMGTGLLNPAKSALISRGAPDDEQGAVLGLNQSFSAMGRMLGPIFSGMLFEWFVGAPFFSAAGLLLIASLVAFNCVRQVPESLHRYQFRSSQRQIVLPSSIFGVNTLNIYPEWLSRLKPNVVYVRILTLVE